MSYVPPHKRGKAAGGAGNAPPPVKLTVAEFPELTKASAKEDGWTKVESKVPKKVPTKSDWEGFQYYLTPSVDTE